MNDKQKAVEDIKKLSRMMKGLIALGDDLETLNSIDQAVSEAKARLAAQQAEEQAVLDRCVQMKAEAEKAVLVAQEVRVKIECDAQKVLSDAKGEAQALVEKAKGEALVIVMEAQKKEKVSLDVVAMLNDQKAALEVQVNEARAKLAELEAKLAALKAKFA